MAPLTISDWLSVSRIPCALFFVSIFSPADYNSFLLGVVLIVAATVTDFLDGYLARKLNQTSLQGYMLDGLGDKVFYSAIVIVAVREGFATTILGFLLISREICLYALRTIDSSLVESLKILRKYSLAHAVFIRLYFLAFLVWCWQRMHDQEGSILYVSQYLGWAAAIVGAYGLYITTRKMIEKNIQ